MKFIYTAVVKLLLACALVQSPSAHSQATWEPLDGVSQMVTWLTKLSEQIDKVIATEKRGQLIRAVDRLRKNLYILEGNAQVLRDSVPETIPTADERKYLSQQSGDLLKVVQSLSENVLDVGAELRLNNSADVEYALTSGLRKRAVVLTDFQRALDRSQSGEWNAPQIRAKLDIGIQAVKAAQLAATNFRRKADAPK